MNITLQRETDTGFLSISNLIEDGTKQTLSSWKIIDIQGSQDGINKGKRELVGVLNQGEGTLHSLFPLSL